MRLKTEEEMTFQLSHLSTFSTRFIIKIEQS